MRELLNKLKFYFFEEENLTKTIFMMLYGSSFLSLVIWLSLKISIFDNFLAFIFVYFIVNRLLISIAGKVINLSLSNKKIIFGNRFLAYFIVIISIVILLSGLQFCYTPNQAKLFDLKKLRNVGLVFYAILFFFYSLFGVIASDKSFEETNVMMWILSGCIICLPMLMIYGYYITPVLFYIICFIALLILIKFLMRSFIKD